MGGRKQDEYEIQEAIDACNDLRDQVYYDRLPEYQMRAMDRALDSQLNAYLRNQAQGIDPSADAILQGLVPRMPRGFGYAPETLAERDAFNACIDQRLPDARRGRGRGNNGWDDNNDPWGNTGRGRNGDRW